MDRSSFLIWNVRGLNDKARQDNLRMVVDDSRPFVVCLQEINLSHITERDVASFLGQDFTNFVYLPAQQTRGGILVAWWEGTFVVTHHRVHLHSVSVFLSNQEDGLGGLQAYMARIRMKIKWFFLMNSGRYGHSSLVLGC